MIVPESRRSAARRATSVDWLDGCRPIGRSRPDDGGWVPSRRPRPTGRRNCLGERPRRHVGSGAPLVIRRSPALASTVFCSVFKERRGHTTRIRGPLGGPMSEAGCRARHGDLLSAPQHPDQQGRSKRRVTLPVPPPDVNHPTGQFSAGPGRPEVRASAPAPPGGRWPSPAATAATGRAGSRRVRAGGRRRRSPRSR